MKKTMRYVGAASWKKNRMIWWSPIQRRGVLRMNEESSEQLFKKLSSPSIMEPSQKTALGGSKSDFIQCEHKKEPVSFVESQHCPSGLKQLCLNRPGTKWHTWDPELLGLRHTRWHKALKIFDDWDKSMLLSNSSKTNGAYEIDQSRTNQRKDKISEANREKEQTVKRWNRK